MKLLQKDPPAEPFIHKIVRSKRRTVGLQVMQDARVVVRVPPKMPIERVHELVRQKLPWILHKQRFVREHYLPVTPKAFVAGEKFLYLGSEYELCMVPGAHGPLDFDEKRFILCEGCASLAKWLFRDWYRDRAAEHFPGRVRHYAGMTGARFSGIKISNARGRWGSCSSRGVLNFNWRLVMAPREVIDYVVAHEVVHLEELNHSKRFWKKVKDLVPDFPGAKRWLERHQLLLQDGLGSIGD
jgi:predicted metal-dependent hydrolase